MTGQADSFNHAFTISNPFIFSIDISSLYNLLSGGGNGIFTRAGFVGVIRVGLDIVPFSIVVEDGFGAIAGSLLRTPKCSTTITSLVFF